MGRHADYEPPYLDETVIVDLTTFSYEAIYRFGGDSIRVDVKKRHRKHRLTEKSYNLDSDARFFDASGVLVGSTHGYLSVGRDLNVGDEFKKAR